VFPLVLIFGGHVFNPNKQGLPHRFLMFNALLGVFMGMFHQAGVVPALSVIQERVRLYPNASVHVVWAYTFPPPRHLLLLPRSYPAFDLPRPCQQVSFHDLRSVSAFALDAAVASLVTFTHSRPNATLMYSTLLSLALIHNHALDAPGAILRAAQSGVRCCAGIALFPFA
jgi:hypothetical protein